MPELPEVETVRNELAPRVIGRTIRDVTLVWDGIVREPAPAEFCAGVIGQAVESVRRRGKYLFIGLGNGRYLVVHLKMTGSLIVGSATDEPPRFTRAVIHLDDGTAVFFRDPRKFGVLRLVDDVGFLEDRLGPEPLDEGFTPEVFAGRLARRTAPIKAALLDQKVLAGVGNMYADEVLHAAGINPWRPAGSLTREETDRLYREIRRILWAAIGNKGASVDTYFRPDGSEGSAHYEFKVAHGLGGGRCSYCGGEIRREVVRGRGSYYCPRCQPLK